MAQHSGFEHTTENGIDTLQHFDKVADAVEKVYPASHLLHEKIKKAFAGYRKVANLMYPFLTYMKSQKKRHLQRFLQLLDPLLLAWDETFPDRKYFLKLHHIMAHLSDFVNKYQMLGRILEESFESVHSLMARIKAMVASMTGDQKRIETANAKCQTKLKPQVMEPSIKITTANIGKKRGPAKNKPTTQNATTTPIEIAFNEVYVEGRQFIDILDGMA